MESANSEIMSPELGDRQRRILARLVVEYIEQGEPVSSAWLAEHSALGLSSATVRSVLAGLEGQGLVAQPHTSAGRVPTDSGYRQYVDGLLGSRKRPRRLPRIEARLRKAGTVGDLLEDASQVVSETSHHIGFVMAPSNPDVRLRHIDFVNLEGTRVLVIVVATGGQITHRVIDTDDRYEAPLLTQAANYLNQEFAGLTLKEARAAIVERMRHERTVYDALMAKALRLARSGLSEAPPETLHVQGASYLVDELLEDAEDRDRTLARLRALFRMVEEKHRLIEMLTQYIEANNLTVVIGSEHLTPDLFPFSVVASTFQDGQRAGTVGVIGPRRMRYRQAISLVDGLSSVMTRVLGRA